MAIRKTNKSVDETIKYEVIEKCGIINERNGGYTLELRYARWNDNEPKYEIRTFKEKEDGTEICGKGITLTGEELEELGKIIAEMAKE